MRIALVGPVYPYRGGIAHYTAKLYKALCEQSHEVLLITFKRQYPKWLFPGQDDKDFSDRNLKISDANYWIDSLNPLTWLRTFVRIRRYRPDALILQWWTTFWAPVWLTFLLVNTASLNVPVVYICHNVIPHEANFWSIFLAKLVLRWGQAFVVQSSEEALKLKSLLPRAKPYIRALPVYNIFSGRQVSKKLARSRLHLPFHVSILLFFGIVREYKGLECLLEAFARAKGELPDLQLLVAGEFWEDKTKYLACIECLKISDDVRLEDRYIPDNEVSLFFSAADVLVAPYQHVTGSGVVQMARGFQLPVITTNLSGLVEVIEDGKTGFLVPVGDVQALSDAIVRYFQESWQTSMSSAMAQSADLFSWESMAIFLGNIIRDML
jgi:glycosyltransferase involved in cell wall biosynthesis